MMYDSHTSILQEENVPSLVKGEIKLPAMQFNDLQWQFKIKEEFSLRLVLHNKDGHMLGLLSISPQTLFSNQTPTVDGTGFLVRFSSVSTG